METEQALRAQARNYESQAARVRSNRQQLGLAHSDLDRELNRVRQLHHPGCWAGNAATISRTELGWRQRELQELYWDLCRVGDLLELEAQRCDMLAAQAVFRANLAAQQAAVT